MAIGALAVLAAEALLIYGIGVTITVPESQATAISMVVAQHLQQEWPQMRRTAFESIRPIMRRQVDNIVANITVDVGGARIVLPPSLRSQVAANINRVLVGNIRTYFMQQFNPAEVLTPALIRQALKKPLAVNIWVDLWRVPVPVTVHMGGSR